MVVAPIPKWRAAATTHCFWRENANDALYNPGGAIVRPGDAGSSRYIGLELDLTLAYSVNRFLNLNGGYSHFFPGSFIEESGASNPIDFLFFLIQVTF